MNFSTLISVLALQAVAAFAYPDFVLKTSNDIERDQIDELKLNSVVPGDDPSVAQGYFLKEAAQGPDQARCLDGTPAVYYHRKGFDSGANKWFIYQEG